MSDYDADQPMPDIEDSNPEEEEELKRCKDEDERKEMSNKETAECAGVELKEMYENEEIGGA